MFSASETCQETPSQAGESSLSVPKRVQRLAISAFLIFHLLAIACWSMPIGSPLIEAVRQCIRPYMRWSGLFQSWDMFAPLPKSENGYIQAVVISHDGHIHTWKFPRMEQLSFVQRYSKERYRKFVENIGDSKYSALWPDTARHLARLYTSPANPPEIVMLIRYWSPIKLETGQRTRAEPEQAHIFFEYRVTAEDLK